MALDGYILDRLREVISKFEPDSASDAAKPLSVEEIFAPESHREALDIERALVIGNRGTGKSVWSGALADSALRLKLAETYENDDLKRADVVLGFHQSAGKVPGVAPSPGTLNLLLRNRSEPENIWTAVLIQGLTPFVGSAPGKDLQKIIKWIEKSPDKADKWLMDADLLLGKKNKKFLLVFDALDRLGKSWSDIRPLTKGALSLALNIKGYSNIRAKVFMRTDQFQDQFIFTFPDASKLKAAKVELKWHHTELYGLLYNRLKKNQQSSGAFEKLYLAATGKKLRAYSKIDDPTEQKEIFNIIAGEYMGTDHRRGRTYTWIIDHLADAFQETTPRNFLVTLQRAARARQKPQDTVIDHHGIREGVQEASAIRVDQLSEDYPWIRVALSDLEGLEVPCLPSSFVRRWKDRKTVDSVISASASAAGPIELERPTGDREVLLLESLVNIGVIEIRSETRINMPDIFRVAAKIKRRGGVKPPTASRKQ
ncbi:hypothetical protein [Pseudomonas sp. PvP001]|uniref:hypothetical protein n=1 Tax=Pseudomonas sp. PvP001 TaxID=3158559 RepID=UPI00339B24A0